MQLFPLSLLRFMKIYILEIMVGLLHKINLLICIHIKMLFNGINFAVFVNEVLTYRYHFSTIYTTILVSLYNYRNNNEYVPWVRGPEG